MLLRLALFPRAGAVSRRPRLPRRRLQGLRPSRRHRVVWRISPAPRVGKSRRQQTLCRRSGFTSDSVPARASSDITDNSESLTTPDAEFPVQANVPVAALREQKPAAPVSALKAVEGWPVFVAFLENHNPILWAKVSHCTVKASGDMLELEVPDMFEKSADGPEFIRKLEDASQAFFGSRLQWMYNKENVPDFPGRSG